MTGDPVQPSEVYILTSGEYSEYGIVAVFLDKEKAEEYASQHPYISRVETWTIEDGKKE